MSLTLHRNALDKTLWHAVCHDRQESVFVGSRFKCLEEMGLDPDEYPDPDAFEAGTPPCLMPSGHIFLGSGWYGYTYRYDPATGNLLELDADAGCWVIEEAKLPPDLAPALMDAKAGRFEVFTRGQ